MGTEDGTGGAASSSIAAPRDDAMPRDGTIMLGVYSAKSRRRSPALTQATYAWARALIAASVAASAGSPGGRSASWAIRREGIGRAVGVPLGVNATARTSSR